LGIWRKPMSKPLQILGRWLKEAEEAKAPQPRAMALVTATKDGRPSARTVSLKRLEDDGLIFTTALWTRKAQQIESNPQVALLFHWPTLGRQAQVNGRAKQVDRPLAEELFAERDLAHQLQTVVSRQGEPIGELNALRARLTHLASVQETAPACPEDWGAIRVRPQMVELWEEAPDRLHERRLFERAGEEWIEALIAP
jgi:pyridoxamine 5'-phosphate oxidase